MNPVTIIEELSGPIGTLMIVEADWKNRSRSRTCTEF